MPSTSLRETFRFIARPLSVLCNLWFVIMMWGPDLPPPGPPRNPNPFSGKKRTHVCWAILLAFAQANTYFPKFSPWFCTRFSTNLTHVLGFFWWGSKLDPCLQIFLCKIHPFGRHISVYLMWEVPPPPALVVGVPKSDFIYLWNASLWEFCNQTVEKVLERGTFPTPFPQLLERGTFLKG